MKRIDLFGRRFGLLAVTSYVGDGKWSCVCDCGARVVVKGVYLRRGDRKSWGCLKRGFRRIDMVGKRLGRVFVTSYPGDNSREVRDAFSRAVVQAVLERVPEAFNGEHAV